jgi:hypothetical protein
MFMNSNSGLNKNPISSGISLLSVPILGVYFLLTPVRPETGSSLEYAYEILSAVSSSFQGMQLAFYTAYISSRYSRHYAYNHRWASLPKKAMVTSFPLLSK